MRKIISRLLSCITLAALIALGVQTTAQAASDPTSTAIGSWGTNGRVDAILVTPNRVYIGGTFTSVTDPSGNSYPIAYLAAYDPSTSSFDTSWSPAPNQAVLALALSADGSGLYIGGKFSSVGGTKETRLAEVTTATGALNTAWHLSAAYTVNTLAVSGGYVYVGGDFTKVTDANGSATDQYLVRADATTGIVDQSWLPQPDAQVHAMVFSSDGSQIFVGGEFTTIAGSTSRPYLADLTTSGMSINTTFTPHGYGWSTSWLVPVLGLAIDGSQLFIAAAGYDGACTSEDSTTGALNWSYGTNGDTQAVSVSNGTVWCGGHFDGSGAFGGQTRKKLAAVDESTAAILPYAPVINSSLGVWSIAATPTGVYAGGDFTRINATSVGHFAFVEPATQETAPLAPGNLRGTAGDGSVSLYWDVPWSDGGSPLTRYAIYRGIPGGTLNKIATSKTTSYTDSGVVDGKTYVFDVVATNAIGSSPASSTVTLTPQAGLGSAPTAPQSLTATNTGSQALLNWTAPANNGGSAVTSYAILRGSTTGGETQIDTVDASTTSYTDSNVTSGSAYFYEVEAINNIGASLPSNEANLTIAATVPGAATLTGSAVANNGGVALNWTVPSDGGSPITGYVIYRNGSKLASVPATTTSYTDTTAIYIFIFHPTYNFYVVATNAVGNGAASNLVSVTP